MYITQYTCRFYSTYTDLIRTHTQAPTHHADYFRLNIYVHFIYRFHIHITFIDFMYIPHISPYAIMHMLCHFCTPPYGLFCGDIGLFCGDIGLFCGGTGLVCGDI